MIMLARNEYPETHALSEAFLSAIKVAALMIRNQEDGWKVVFKVALDAEFPSNAEMKTFAESSFSEIVGLLLKGHTTIYIHRSVKDGLELFADEPE